MVEVGHFITYGFSIGLWAKPALVIGLDKPVHLIQMRRFYEKFKQYLRISYVPIKGR